jgi:putative membrane protein
MRLGKLIINALALVAASLIVPNNLFKLNFGLDSTLIYLLLLAVIFAVINTFIRPIAKLASLPLSLLTLGIVGFLVNAAMLILLAYVAGQLQHDPYALRLAQFPPNFNADTVVAAVLGSIVISIVSTVLAWFVPDK